MEDFFAKVCGISGWMVRHNLQEICRVCHLLAASISIMMPLRLLCLLSLDLATQISGEHAHLFPIFLRATLASVSTSNVLQEMISNFAVRRVDHRDVSRFLRKCFIFLGSACSMVTDAIMDSAKQKTRNGLA